MIKTPIRRMGKKSEVLEYLYPYFPPHEIFVEPFAGSGVVALNNPYKPKQIFCNDLEDCISEFYAILQDTAQTENLLDYLECMPYAEGVWNKIRKGQLPPQNSIQKVGQFLVLSNFGYLGKANTLLYGIGINSKAQLLQQIQTLSKRIAKYNIVWTCKDFRSFIKSVTDRDKDYSKAFCYCDPPYLGTANNYNTPKWTAQDLQDLVQINVEKGWKFAISEFENPTILDCAQKYGLNLIEVGERKNIKNRRVEIMLTNYAQVIHNELF